MNKYFTKYIAITLCVIHAAALGNGSSRLKSLRKATDILSPQHVNAAKVFGGMALGALANKAYTNSVNGKNFYDGKYAKGFYAALQISGACFTFAPMLNEQYGSQLFRYGVRAPIGAAIAIGVYHPYTQQLIHNAPFIGEHLSSYKKQDYGKLVSKCGSECQGLCIDCGINKTLAVLGIYMVVDPLVDRIGTYLGQKLGIIDEDNDDLLEM